MLVLKVSEKSRLFVQIVEQVCERNSVLESVGGRLYLSVWELQVEGAQVVRQYPVFVSFLAKKTPSTPAM